MDDLEQCQAYLRAAHADVRVRYIAPMRHWQCTIQTPISPTIRVVAIGASLVEAMLNAYKLHKG